MQQRQQQEEGARQGVKLTREGNKLEDVATLAIRCCIVPEEGSGQLWADHSVEYMFLGFM